ncbi:MAG: TonB-dependent receptor, partial [Bacteroidales bacterium]|nr:TonB-dependent receptor [Bacteroidales bacterium]
MVLLGTDPLQGTVTGEKGDFCIENVPVGRQGIRVSYVGFRGIDLTNLNITTGKELILFIELEESVEKISEVVIRPGTGKDQPVSDMAVISARSFTIEETERYAGSVGDPSRMASSFAGVSTLSDQQNEIVIRGNSPMGLLWRMDGVDIPNPNHFASLGTTGGGLSMINNNTLSNSDFFTGAFPPEYGNALSGVFDLKMRNGNNENYEFTAQVGFNGVEAGAEGPVSRNKGSSFLLNYRYSMLLLIDKIIGAEALSVSAVPFYHDLTFKFNFPNKKYGKFSITGIGGVSGINENEYEKDSLEWSSDWKGSDYHFGSRMGTVLASHTYFFNTTTRLETIAGFSGVNSTIKEDTFTVMNPGPAEYRRQNSWMTTLQAGSSLRKKLNVKDRFDAGINARFIIFSFSDEVSAKSGELVPNIMVDGNSFILKGFFQWQHRFNDELELIGGFHGFYYGYNHKTAFDPRLSCKWQINGRHSFSLGTGIFSQLPEQMFYYTETELPDGQFVRTNKNLGYMKSLHLVAGYDFLIRDGLRLKSEVYYQHLFHIPVKENIPAYSMLNYGEDSFSAMPVIDSLVSEGTGNNFGMELTVERFLNKGWYFLFTTSIFKSVYRGYDKILRNTAFSNNFVFNLLAGKEFRIRGKNFLNF